MVQQQKIADFVGMPTKMPEFLVDIDLCKMVLKLEVLDKNAKK